MKTLEEYCRELDDLLTLHCEEIRSGGFPEEWLRTLQRMSDVIARMGAACDTGKEGSSTERPFVMLEGDAWKAAWKTERSGITYAVPEPTVRAMKESQRITCAQQMRAGRELAETIRAEIAEG